MFKIEMASTGQGEWAGRLYAFGESSVNVTVTTCSGPSREAVRIAVYQEACRLLGEALLSA